MKPPNSPPRNPVHVRVRSIILLRPLFSERGIVLSPPPPHWRNRMVDYSLCPESPPPPPTREEFSKADPYALPPSSPLSLGSPPVRGVPRFGEPCSPPQSRHPSLPILLCRFLFSGLKCAYKRRGYCGGKRGKYEDMKRAILPFGPGTAFSPNVP